MICSIPAWEGKAYGVNKWHGAQAIFRQNAKPSNGMKVVKGRTLYGRWIGSIFENTNYKKFKQLLAEHIAVLIPPGHKRIDGRVDLLVKLCAHKIMDSDAVIKPIFDAIEDSGVLPNDRQIRNFCVQRAYHPKSKHDTIVIEFYRAKANETDWARNSIEVD